MHDPLHHLQCLSALGYSAMWVGQIAGTDDYERWAEPGYDRDPYAEACLAALWDVIGQKVATPATTGMTQNRITSTRARARKRGWLPPFAYEEDEQGNLTTIAVLPYCVQNTTPADPRRSEDRVAMQRFAAVHAVLADPTLNVETAGEQHGLSRVWSEIGALHLNEIRRMDGNGGGFWSRGWIDHKRCAHLWRLCELVAANQIDPLEAWEEFTGEPFERIGSVAKTASAAA